jgi:hypothetical protein
MSGYSDNLRTQGRKLLGGRADFSTELEETFGQLVDLISSVSTETDGSDIKVDTWEDAVQRF